VRERLTGTWSYYLLEILIHLVNFGILVYGIVRTKPGGWIFLLAYLIFFTTYEFICDHTCDEEMIPPLVIHPLIGNGLTHKMKPRENGTFWFSCHRERGLKRYVLKNNSSVLLTDAVDNPAKHTEGTRLQYIRSWLEEAFPGKRFIKFCFETCNDQA
jgi:hypothetical protein